VGREMKVLIVAGLMACSLECGGQEKKVVSRDRALKELKEEALAAAQRFIVSERKTGGSILRSFPKDYFSNNQAIYFVSQEAGSDSHSIMMNCIVIDLVARTYVLNYLPDNRGVSLLGKPVRVGGELKLTKPTLHQIRVR